MKPLLPLICRWFFRSGWVTVATLLFSVGLHAEETLYTCGMHPAVIRKEPGDCPLCNMQLQPVRANAAGEMTGLTGKTIEENKPVRRLGQTVAVSSDDPNKGESGTVGARDDVLLPRINIDARTIQKMNLKTALVKKGPVRREIRAVGIVTYDEQGLRDITTKYDGWIEKLYVNTTWGVVKAGDPLFDIYSSDLYKAQMSFLMASRSEGTTSGQLTKASLSRLQLYDLSGDFLADLVKTGEAHPNFTFRAPVSGTIIERFGIVGQMIKSGERIYRIADLSSVWVLAQIYENDLPFIHPGQDATVNVTYGTARKLSTQVALVQPQIDERTRTATARLVVPNTEGSLRPGMFVDVRFTCEIAETAVLVPDLAVLRSGEHTTVFIALEGGAFEPREIQLGARSEGNDYQVLHGLASGERVVTSGQFMLDSESQLRDAIQKMLTPSLSSPNSEQPAAPMNRMAPDEHAAINVSSSAPVRS